MLIHSNITIDFIKVKLHDSQFSTLRTMGVIFLLTFREDMEPLIVVKSVEEEVDAPLVDTPPPLHGHTLSAAAQGRDQRVIETNLRRRWDPAQV